MMRSMNSAVSGLRNHQTYMDVVGNNIANVNTTGFRASRVAFQDMLSQTARSAGAPTTDRGGTNPQQVGLGVTLGSIDTIQTQGNLESTGKPTDLALEGDGYFVVNDGDRSYYTRDGAFDRSIDGSLVNAAGLKVMGWQGKAGSVDTTRQLEPITIPLGQGMRASASTVVKPAGNLASSTPTVDTVPATNANVVKTDVSIRDSLGQSHTVSVTFTHTGANAWSWVATSPATATTPATPLANGALTFDANGQLLTPIAGAMPPVTFPAANGADPTEMTLDLSGLTQLDGASDLQATADGAAAGYLTTFAVDKTGVITGVYSNGVREELGQIAVATFANPGGLSKTGGNLWDVSANSGQPQVGAAGIGGRGSVSPGTLEMSNVDLAQQFTNMIKAERGFQANSRVITASDQILQDLVNLIR
jgi:flagellar hook protein FlgE